MVAYNIGQLAYMHAKAYDLKRVFFGGFFIRGHPYTMETISFAIKFWSQGKMSALFLRHEGFLGAVGAFLKVHPMHVPTSSSAAAMAAAVAAAAGADGSSAAGAAVRPSLKAAGRDASTKVWVGDMLTRWLQPTRPFRLSRTVRMYRKEAG
jgi:type II pantothenate kinase